MKCNSHLDFTNGVCEDCKLSVDRYGNTEEQFDFCSFPDCGCDGARLCMAKNGASENCIDGNVEGMWSGNDEKSKLARHVLITAVNLFAKPKDGESK